MAQIKKDQKESLFFAVTNPLSAGEIYQLDSLENPKPKQISVRKSEIFTMVEHEGRLYDAGYYIGIFETKTNTSIEPIPKGIITKLCSFNGKLYAGTRLGEIYNISDGILIAERKGRVTDICSHEGVLYDSVKICSKGDSVVGVFKTETGEKVFDDKLSVNSLISFNGTLYAIQVNYENPSLIFDVLNNKIVNSRRGQIKDMIDYNGTLIDITERTLNATNENVLLASSADENLEKLVSFNNRLIVASEKTLFEADPSIGPVEDGKLKAIFGLPSFFRIAALLSSKS